MKRIPTLPLAIIALSFLGLSAQAEEEVTLVGVMSCEKCELKIAEACSDALKVGDKLYHLEEDGNRKTGSHVCKGTADVTVKGKVEDRDGKAFVVVSSIEKN